MNVDKISGSFFLDTNIFAYSFDSSVPEKQQVAQRLISDALRTQRGVISTQVVQEFLNLALRKFATPLTISESIEYLQTVLLPLCQHFPTIGFYERALWVRNETSYSFYDSLIVAAAIDTDCSILFSEDLQGGRNVRRLTIINPFVTL